MIPRLAALAIVLALTGQPAATDVVVERDVMVPMRDGVRLATDIYRPAREGRPVSDKLPVLLQRTPYGKDGRGLVEQARAFARHGYVVALQDERGSGRSEGVQIKYIGQGKDGFDTVEWLAKLPYTDGQVGMWGTSYAAHAQASAAILNPPHLKALLLNCGGLHNGWDHKIRNHGAFELGQQVGWAFAQVAAQQANPAAAERIKREKTSDWAGILHARRGSNPLTAAPNFESYIFDMMTRGDYDAYWKQPDVNWSEHYAETADIPMLHVSGWYDPYAGGAVANYLGLSKVKKAAQRLLVGPWLHGRNTDASAGDLEFGSDAGLAEFPGTFHLRWFDHFLKSARNGVETEPAIKLWVMGTGDGRKTVNGRLFHGGYWMTAASWPVPGTKRTPYYLQSGGALSLRAPSSDSKPSAYDYDPARPAPTLGGSFTTQAGLMTAGGFDQWRMQSRPDVVVFQTGALEEDLKVIGPIEVRLFASSSALDTDFTAKLIDVYPVSKDYPEGYALNVTDGIVRARYRSSPERPEPMTPGQVYEFRIEPFPTANVFKKGHRIRIDVSSSNFPRFDVNPNTGEPLGRHTRTITARNTIYHDARHPSAVVLPVVATR
jgi:putative CocE/NonD family hydrolase